MNPLTTAAAMMDTKNRFNGKPPIVCWVCLPNAGRFFGKVIVPAGEYADWKEKVSKVAYPRGYLGPILGVAFRLVSVIRVFQNVYAPGNLQRFNNFKLAYKEVQWRSQAQTLNNYLYFAGTVLIAPMATGLNYV